MDAQQALADLTEISSQIGAAVLFAEEGDATASTVDDQRAARMVEAARELLSAAERTRPGLGPGTLAQLEIATLEGSVFLVRDHGNVIAATTSPEPTVGLVFYDLKSCLRTAAEGKPKAPAPKRKPPTRNDDSAKPARRRAPKQEDGDAAS